MLVFPPKRKVTAALFMANYERAENCPETRQAAAGLVGSEHACESKTIWRSTMTFIRRVTQKTRETARNICETGPPAAASSGSEDGYVRSQQTATATEHPTSRVIAQQTTISTAQ